MKTIEDLRYIMNAVNDLQDASEGSYLAEITAVDLDDVNDFASRLASNKLSVNILIMMINHVTNENAAAPDSIAESIFEHINELQQLSDQRQNEIYDAIHTLTSCLVKDVGIYL